MPKRRANGEGNIRKRKDGRWEGRYTAGYDANGKAITKNVLGRTQAEVKDKLRAAIEDSKKLDPVKAGSYTLEQWLMLAVGRAMMAKPQLLLLDEPSLGLAPLIIADIFNMIQRIRDLGVTVLLVEQNARMALRISDRGYVLETGTIVMSDDAKALLKSDVVRNAYLGKEA